jgi:hypothetical protein
MNVILGILDAQSIENVFSLTFRGFSYHSKGKHKINSQEFIQIQSRQTHSIWSITFDLDSIQSGQPDRIRFNLGGGFSGQDSLVKRLLRLQSRCSSIMTNVLSSIMTNVLIDIVFLRASVFRRFRFAIANLSETPGEQLLSFITNLGLLLLLPLALPLYTCNSYL